MKLKEQQLDRSQLNDFILQNSEKFKEGLDTVIAGLKQKAKLMRKNVNGDEEEVLKEAGTLGGIAKFLKKISFDKLTTKALLDKKSLRKKFNTVDASKQQRAVYIFASHKNVKPIIMEFREQYPNWMNAKDLVLEKTEKKENEQILTEVTNGLEVGEGKIKIKKKTGKKSLKRKNIETNNDVNDNVIKNPKKKKRKPDSSGHASGTEGSSTNEELQELQSEVLQNEVSKESGSSSAREKQGGFNRRNPWQKGRGGKFNGRGNFHQNMRNRNANFKGRNGSWKQAGWQQRKFCDKNSPNSIPVTSDWQNKAPSTNSTEGQTTSLLRPSWLTNPEERKPTHSFRGRKNFGKREPASANKIRVTSECKGKPATPKSEEGQTTSLLRPDWLTNPQEKKPAASFNRSRGNFKKWKKR